MRKVIIEVRCNEYAMREANPHVPWTPTEIAEDAARCREAGAAMLHYHAREPESGAPSSDPEIFAESVRRIRAASDLLITPTLGVGNVADPMERMNHIVSMAQDPATRPDFAPVDSATANIDPYRSGQGFLTEDSHFINTIGTARRQLEGLRHCVVRPEMVLWAPGGGRVLDAFVAAVFVDEPLWVGIQLSDLLLSALPATARGLTAMLEFLPRGRQLEWIALHAAGNGLPLVPTTVAMGGHVSLGLGDDPHRTLGTPTNAEVIAEAARLVRLSGAEVATPDEAREILGLEPPG